MYLFRQAWADLGAMTRNESVRAFIKHLGRSCASFKLYIEAHRREREKNEQQATTKLNNINDSPPPEATECSTQQLYDEKLDIAFNYDRYLYFLKRTHHVLIQA